MSPARTGTGEADRLASLVAAIRADLSRMRFQINAVEQGVDALHSIALDYMTNNGDSDA